MEKINLPIPSEIKETSQRDDILNALKVFNENANYIEELKEENYCNYSKFIESNRKFIKKIMPEKNKVYKVIELGDYFHYYSLDCRHLIKYVFITRSALEKKPDYYGGKLIQRVKAIPLDENGNLIQKELWDGTKYTLGECKIEITGISVEYFPEITKKYLKNISKQKDKEIETYRRLQRKYGNID